MISNIYIITTDGVVRYSKSIFGSTNSSKDIISFLTLITRVSKKIGGGNISSLNFEKFNFIYDYGNHDYVFIITTDSHDLEEEARVKLKLLKEEYFKIFIKGLEKGIGENEKYEMFDQFIEKHLVLTPKILLIGEDGVGKSTIMNLFPGETILELDDDMTELVKKTIKLSDIKGINEFVLIEINFKDLIDNITKHKSLIDTVDIICMVTNSGADNLSRTKNLYSHLKERIKNKIFYIFANFQDSINSAFDTEKISESFGGLQTFGFSAIQEAARGNIEQIIKKILENAIMKKG
ncbi:MAG: GTPase domain-containing protein [Candidatus Hodarchaeota archaeon]